MRLWLALALLLFLAGCVSDAKYNECLEERDLAHAQIGNLEIALQTAADEIDNLEEEILRRNDQITLLEEQLSTCEEAFIVLNDSCQITWKANTTRYSFTCSEIPLNTPPYSDLSRYRCYWDIRDRYGFGQYYDPMTICVRHNVAGWIESCACVNEMREIYGKEVTTYFGPLGIEVSAR